MNGKNLDLVMERVPGGLRVPGPNMRVRKVEIANRRVKGG